MCMRNILGFEWQLISEQAFILFDWSECVEKLYLEGGRAVEQVSQEIVEPPGCAGSPR